ncbi:TOTE conflict system archaeo-eukaryotic primase domain-containing protein [Marinobacter sp. ELB17]|uniref:TOTE conflict system archaeo-eukaryotic primase domain-containing protein n=1 Tax=Marinobacter sp. ELB17 TaxID=270374 RepID=UPI0000F39A73|nr:DEAD/DEAH box helicase [Marinobacter sp. ELB17]EAZ99864.1 DNA or RNA helicase of superfamily II [Marinobacter sp. ELB17]
MDEELAAIELKLSEIEKKKAALLSRKKELHQAARRSTLSHLTPAQKVELFRTLFRGRQDIYAIRWQGSGGRSGYAVACENEWAPGICQKPKIKCGECPHRKFKPLDFNAVYDHLSGKHTAGLYPLLPDSSCYLLAVDFDKDDWRADVRALAEACRGEAIPYLVEVSQSGAGAHLWIFFPEAVSAFSARALGFKLLDKAMELYPGLSFDSYDRLFPNQDTMPDGGFGNLIALPLQHEARNRGCTVFVDDELTPYADQWTLLSEQKTLSLAQLREMVGKGPDSDLTAEVSLPWEQSLPVEAGIITGCPERITLILANHIYMKLSDIPGTLATRIKRMASFANPVFFKTQALRFSTHGIPRYISCARIEQGYLSVPRGCFDQLQALLFDQEITVDIDDRRIPGQLLSGTSLKATLRDDQKKAVKALADHDTGILHAPTAFGKTVTAIAMVAKRGVNTLILTHSRQLLDQWKERLETFIEGAAVGVIGGGKKKPTGQIDVATYQSLINKKDNTVSSLVREYGQVIIDECHHISAPRYEMLLNEVSARYVVGLTATPDRQDGHQKIMFMVAGPVRHKVRADHSSRFVQRLIVRERHESPPTDIYQSGGRPHIASVYRWLSQSPARNQDIVQDIANCVRNQSNCLLLTERREHAETLAIMLDAESIPSVVLRGGMRVRERRDAEARLHEAQVIVATGKYIGEGFDLPRLDTLFLALPIAWKGTLAQYAGRIHREADGKQEVTVYDYLDAGLPMLERMFRKREKGYKAMGYKFVSSGQPRLL